MDGKPEHVAMEAVSRVPWAIIYKGKRPGSSVVDRTAEPKGGVIREGGGHRWYRFVAGVDRSGGEGEIAPYENLYLCPSPGRTDVSVFPRDALGCYRVDDGEGRDLYVEFSVHKCGNGRRGRGIRTSRLWPGRLLRRVLWDPFLPHGYPDSVPPDYFAFQFWDTVQGFCSYVRGMLTSHALMKGVGVGVDDGSTALGAVFVFLMRDISGMISGVAFASLQGTKFDSRPKHWRLFADTMNNVGLFIDLVAPQLIHAAPERGGSLGGHRTVFLVMLSLARICFAIVGVAGGASRSALTYHFSRNGNNAADIAAKEGSQETLASLAGMLTGYWLLKFLDGLGTAIRLRAQWLAFTVLTVLHMFANFRAVRALELNTMNEESMRFAWRAFSRRSKVATPAEYAKYELSFPAYFVDSLKDGWLSQGKVKVDVDFGCPLTDLFDGGDHSMSWDLSDPINENFFINVSLTETGARIHVSLRGGLSEEDRLRAFIQAESIKEQLSSRQQKLDKETVYDVLEQTKGFFETDGDHRISPGYLTSDWTRFFRQLKKAGWDVSSVHLTDKGFRSDICYHTEQDEDLSSE